MDNELGSSTGSFGSAGGSAGFSEPVRPAPVDPIRGYFRTLWAILTRPTEFFRAMPLRGGVASPLAFALVTHWVGSAIAFVWRALIGGAVGGYIDQLTQMAGDVAEVDNPGRNAQLVEISEHLKHWVWGAGAVIVDPFLTLAQVLFVSFLVFVGARLLVTPGKNGAPKEITFESTLRIVCYSMAPSILAALPLLGGPVAYLYRVVVSVIGARETYRIDGFRAMLVALFPQFLLMGFVMMIVFALALVAIKFMAMVF